MRIFNFLVLSVFLFLCNNYVHAQLTKSIDEMEVQYKECQRAKPDSTVCSRLYLSQMDSMLTVVFEKLKAQLSSEEKLALVKDQASWTEKKGKFFKKDVGAGSLTQEVGFFCQVFLGLNVHLFT